MTKTILPLLKAIGRDSRGATAIEYGLLVSMMGLAVYAMTGFGGSAIISMWDIVSNRSTTALTGPSA